MWLIVFLDDAEAEVVSLKKKIQTAEDEHSTELTRYQYCYATGCAQTMVVYISALVSLCLNYNSFNNHYLLS